MTGNIKIPQSLFIQTQTLLKVASKSADTSSKIEIIRIFKKYLNDHHNIPKSYNKSSINNTLEYQSITDQYLITRLDIPSQANEVIKPFLTMEPIPTPSTILKVLNGNSDLDLNKTALNLLLYRHKDPRSCFDLITMNSKSLHQLEKSKFLDKLLVNAVTLGAINLGMEYLQLVEISTYLMLDFCVLNFLFIKQYLNSLLNVSGSSVISWRPGNSIYHKLFNNYKFRLLSKAVNIMNDVYTSNVDNYNLKDSSLLKSFESNGSGTAEFLAKQLRLEGMMLKKSEQEKMFQEYWDNAGDGFEWIEPEKDPVEYINI